MRPPYQMNFYAPSPPYCLTSSSMFEPHPPNFVFKLSGLLLKVSKEAYTMYQAMQKQAGTNSAVIGLHE